MWGQPPSAVPTCETRPRMFSRGNELFNPVILEARVVCGPKDLCIPRQIAPRLAANSVTLYASRCHSSRSLSLFFGPCPHSSPSPLAFKPPETSPS